MTQVVPAIIPDNREQLEEEVSRVSFFAPLIQIDISDGIFTRTKTWPYNGQDRDYFNDLVSEAEGLPQWEDVDFEVHLMVKHPEEVVMGWIHTGATAILGHIEATENFQELIDICKENLVSVGMAIKPSTDLDKAYQYISQVDFVQVMGSDHLGEHGIPLDEKAVAMISKLRREYPDLEIAIDIGVNMETKDELLDAGATKLISGGTILDADNPEEVYLDLSE
jgi:pentose-5-phosphate-3-epimerase